MKSYYSESCSQYIHHSCKDPNCQCGCHTLKINAKELEVLKNNVRKEEAEALDSFLGKFAAEGAEP